MLQHFDSVLYAIMYISVAIHGIMIGMAVFWWTAASVRLVAEVKHWLHFVRVTNIY